MEPLPQVGVVSPETELYDLRHKPVARDRWFSGIHAPPPHEEPPAPKRAKVDKQHPHEARLLRLDIYGTLKEKTVSLTRGQLEAMYTDVRERALRCMSGLTEEELLGVPEPSLNPLVWGIGHCAHFYESMVLRLLQPGVALHPAGSGSLLAGWDVDGAFDSFRADHDDRWAQDALAEVAPRVNGVEPCYPSSQELISGYRDRVVGLLLERLAHEYPDDTEGPGPVETYLHTYGIVHEHWHIEDWIQTRQTMGYPAPERLGSSVVGGGGGTAIANPWGGTFRLDPPQLGITCRSGPLAGDVHVPGGEYCLGATKDQRWLFDAERYEHTVTLEPFAISRAPVTNGEFAEFIAAGGYTQRALWCHEGWRWLTRKQPVLNVGQHEVDDTSSTHPREKRGAPRYWRRGSVVSQGDAEGKAVLSGWVTTVFDQPTALFTHQPVVHVSWYEASAYCRWKGRRLPTEAEWEAAALCEPKSAESISEARKRLYPWGDAPPAPERCNIDGYRGGLLEVGALPESDSAFGCRQMMGQVWEWTHTAFYPYPGFLPDFPYRENSCPWFGYRKVVKGGCWATSSMIARGGYRHSFWPNMDAVFTGFRTASDL